MSPSVQYGGAAAAVSDAGWLRALLDVEGALARAQAAAGLLAAEHADAVATACREQLAGADGDPADSAAQALRGELHDAGGNPVAAVVRLLRARLEEPTAALVQRGATDEDVLATAAMLVCRRALGPLLTDLTGAANAAARLAAEHRDSAMAARTLLQHVVPTTFGAKAAGWMRGLDEAAARLAELRDTRLAIQLTDAAAPVRAQLAVELELAEPLPSWQTQRTRIGELAGALGGAASTIGKAARDVALMAQDDVAELREGVPAGASAGARESAAVAALERSSQAPGLAASLLAAMIAGDPRAADAWQAQWRPLGELLIATGSAAAWLRLCLDHLAVDVPRMRTNLDAAGLAPVPDSTGEAVERALATRRHTTTAH